MKKIIYFGAAAVATLVIAVACKKSFNGNEQFAPRGTFAGPFTDTAVLPSVIDEYTELSASTLWILDGKTFVTGNTTLVIEEGARIEAKKKSTNDSASALVITRGSKLEAIGSSTSPIVFTSNQATPAPGDWGGIVILGKAPLNRADTTIEGINLPSVPAGVNVSYGGGGAGLGIANDNSGSLQYIRIEYAGATISTDNELNGLTLGGVGSGTVLSYIEVALGNDDAFEFFGGTVNADHLFAFVPDDDAFDFDFGYRGHIQFAVSVLNTAAPNYSSSANGIESDNNAINTGDTPRTKALLSNLTVIGLNTSAQASTANLKAGGHYRRQSSYILRNSVIIGWPTGLKLETTPTQYDSANASHNIIQAFTTLVDGGVATLYNNKKYLGGNANDSVNLAAPFASTPDFRPVTGSPALTLGVNWTGLSGASGITTSPTYRGAFGAYVSGSNTNNWLAGWASYTYNY